MDDERADNARTIHAVGVDMDDLLEVYEAEMRNLEAMKLAFAMAGKTLEDYRCNMLKELEESKLPVREAEYGKTYVNRCVELVRRLFDDVEAKRLRSLGACEAMKLAVAKVKSRYNNEINKNVEDSASSVVETNKKEYPIKSLRKLKK